MTSQCYCPRSLTVDKLQTLCYTINQLARQEKKRVCYICARHSWLYALRIAQGPVGQKYCHTGETCTAGRDEALRAVSACTHDDICGSGIGLSGSSVALEN